MIQYAAFLRAINVGGSKVIRMEELKGIFELLKLKNVRTYIQSGNVLFESAEQDAVKLRSRIERQLSEALGYDVTTTLRSRREIDAIIKKNPFAGETLSRDLVLYIALLETKPSKEAVTKFLANEQDDDEKYAFMKDNLYCLIRKKTKNRFSNNYVERKIGLKATTRNMTTIVKILDLLTLPVI